MKTFRTLANADIFVEEFYSRKYKEAMHYGIPPEVHSFYVIEEEYVGLTRWIFGKWPEMSKKAFKQNNLVAGNKYKENVCSETN